MTNIQAGDKVNHVYHPWDAPCVVERVEGAPVFADDPIAFFVGGGFWRTSRLRRVAPEEQPK